MCMCKHRVKGVQALGKVWLGPRTGEDVGGSDRYKDTGWP